MSERDDRIHHVVDVVIRVGLLLGLVAWCLMILSPFLSPVLWAILLTVVLHPVYHGLSSKLGGRKKASATIITLVMLAAVVIPSYLFFDSLIDGVKTLGTQMETGDFEVPPPTEQVKDWPVIGDKTYDAWLLASQNLDKAIDQYADQIASFGSKAASYSSTM